MLTTPACAARVYNVFVLHIAACSATTANQPCVVQPYRSQAAILSQCHAMQCVSNGVGIGMQSIEAAECGNISCPVITLMLR